MALRRLRENMQLFSNLKIEFAKIPVKRNGQTTSGANKTRISLKGLVEQPTPLYGKYKGKEYQALLTPEGTIKFNGSIFNSLYYLSGKTDFLRFLLTFSSW
jgi:hypothetical protein